ncbi:DUF6435 family protein [Gilvimarinus sp. SDUM040013]|uniref:DUF6435 family protein n=1 Tax=Gilvimarinus gilvus TaxID=3058038 RepID=A0ABU4S338_9GAMM|nr:DUF6435 family protein [Gilvimarinus sp. SDUM040013]MDO3387164.1 DUF6435 family protein [Gilvimarinus sp. SDUM040013]MDX6850907.1 DUF6435 family protein [Gilvimarinus sp. SDUM040013]
MLSFLRKDPTKKLQKSYEAILEKAMLAQRSGDIKTYSLLTEEAEKVRAQIEAIQAEQVQH